MTVHYQMVSIDQLRVCKSCGNVFSKKAGVSIITECPQCGGSNFDSVERQDELVQE